MRPPTILDVMRAQQGFAQGLAIHEAKITEYHVALTLLLEKGIITVEEMQAKYEELQNRDAEKIAKHKEEARAGSSEKEGKLVSLSGEGDKSDSEEQSGDGA
jgi:hypothetical protein